MEIQNKRIGSLEFRPCTYLLPKDKWPKHPGWDIVLWYPNKYYLEKDKYSSNDGVWFYEKDNDNVISHYRVHESCFKNPESCFSVVTFNYDDEGYYEVKFIADRPLSLKDDERKIFWELLEYGNTALHKALKEELDKDKDNY